MHELSLIQGLMNRLEEVVKENKAKRVKSIWLKVGPLSGAEPQLLKEAFNFFSKDGIAAGAELHIDSPLVTLKCDKCGAEAQREYFTLSCTECGAGLPISDGSEALMLEQLELEME
ncbi:MAG: hydrogenase maturation nickel metallochaperone HypA [Proteobacteria bacterium]|nr:hydrogenase maturation nickel metallochaperone HypA [Pseudomonadota bacterium]